MRLQSQHAPIIAAFAASAVVAASVVELVHRLFPGAANAFMQASESFAPYAACLVGVLAVLVFLRMRPDFKTSHDLASLAEFQKPYWAAPAPAKNMSPSQTVSEFLAANGVAVEGRAMDRDACTAAMARQLGEPWPGIERAPLHVKCLAAMAAVHGLGGRKGIGLRDGLTLRRDVAVAHASIDDVTALGAAVEAIVRRHLDNKAVAREIERIGRKHHYTATVLMRLTDWARKEGGVLPCAEFLWLKAVDRPLWYALNNVGRQSFHVEGAGAVAHFRAESTMCGPLTRPRVEKAVDGVVEVLKTRERGGGTAADAPVGRLAGRLEQPT
jgi:hypothetical protein